MRKTALKTRLTFRWKPVLKTLLATTLFLSTTACNELAGFLGPLFDEDGSVEPYPNNPSDDIDQDPIHYPGDGPILTPGDDNNVLVPINDSDIVQQPMPGVDIVKGNDQSGEIDSSADMQIVSAEYTVNLKNPVDGDTVAIQLPLSLIPDGLGNAQIQPERYDNKRGEWLSTGKLSWYDAETKSVWFRDQLPVTVAPPAEFATEFATQQVSSEAVKYRVRIYLFSNLLTVHREGSQFRIHYYPNHLANKNKVISDAEWSSPNGSKADNIPDFVEDLDTALNSAYNGLIQINHSQGKVFKALDIQDVYISDTGNDAGDSKLGGPLRISNTKIISFEDLKLTAAHELVHVFQGQYYSLKGLFTGRYNHWFIEAVANYYAARANGLDDAGKKAFYGDFYSDYLSVALSSNLDNSMYAAGYFLDWASDNYGLNVVGDALRLSSGNDMVGLSKAIKENSNGASNIGSAFESYLEEILTRPENTAGFNLDIRNSMAQHSFGNGFMSSIMLNQTRTYARLKKELPPLSAALISLNLSKLKSTEDGYRLSLFVIANHGNQGALLNGRTYLMESNFNKDYKDARSIDRYLNHGGFSELHEFSTFDTLSQMMYNSSPASNAKVDMSYYALPRPQFATDTAGERGLDLKYSVGNIPGEFLLGFKAYNYNGDLLVGPVPVQTSRGIQKLNLPEDSWSQHYTISDKFGNEWPYAILLKQSNFNNGSYIEEGETIRIEAKLIGFDDDNLKWDIKSDLWAGDPPGSLSAGGKSASYTATDSSTYDTITVTSSKYPFLKASVSISDDIGGCVSSGTLITLADGSRKSIEEFKVGDQIRAWDQETGQVVQAEVKQLLIHQGATYTLHRLKGSDGDEIQITGNHPIFTKESGWIPVEDLKAGMTLYQLDHQSKAFVPTVVKGIIKEESTANVVYNLLTTEGNYFANDLLIHNKCLAQGTLINSPKGLIRVEELKPGDLVYSSEGHETMVSKVYRKETVLPVLPGKNLPEGGQVTNNHRIYWQGQWQSAGQTELKEALISGPVYDLETAAGSYRSGTVIMGK